MDSLSSSKTIPEKKKNHHFLMAGEAYGQPNRQSGGTHGDAATQSVRALLFSSCSTAKIVNMEAKPQN